MKEKERLLLKKNNHNIRSMFERAVDKVSDTKTPTKLSLFKLWEGRCSNPGETAPDMLLPGRGGDVKAGDDRETGDAEHTVGPSILCAREDSVRPGVKDNVCNEMKSTVLKKVASK